MTQSAATVEPSKALPIGYLEALNGVLVAQALPVWGWGLGSVYQRFVMEGYTLEHWVRTASMWGEVEWHAWEWRQMTASLQITDESLPSWVHNTVDRVASSVSEWIDLALCQEYIDGIGFHFISACRDSSYGPLSRTARLLVSTKWGHVATGQTHLVEALRDRNVEPEVLRERIPSWRDIARDLAENIAAAETQWADSGIVDPLDLEAAIQAADERVDSVLESTHSSKRGTA